MSWKKTEIGGNDKVGCKWLWFLLFSSSFAVLCTGSLGRTRQWQETEYLVGFPAGCLEEQRAEDLRVSGPETQSGGVWQVEMIFTFSQGWLWVRRGRGVRVDRHTLPLLRHWGSQRLLHGQMVSEAGIWHPYWTLFQVRKHQLTIHWHSFFVPKCFIFFKELIVTDIAMVK